MKPILELYYPIPGVGVLKIFQPTIHDDTVISFLVILDGRTLSFKLYHNGEWNEMNKEGVSQEIIAFIRKTIEGIYQV